MEIRDTRNGSWYWVNTAVNACPHISHADKSVYGALASYAGYKEIRPSFETIAVKSATSTRQAKRSIKNLIKVGYLEIEKGGGRGHTNVYALLKCAKGCKKCTVYKGCKKVSETVTGLHLKGDKFTPHIDKDRYINKKENLCFLLKDWNNRQSSPLQGFKPENIVNKYGAEKIEAMVKEYGKRDSGFSQFLQALKGNIN